MERMRRGIRTQTGLENAAIALHATHSHSGPQTSEALSPLIGEVSPAYLECLEATVVAGAAQAVAVLEPVEAYRGSGHCGIGINRRRIEDGRVRMAPNPDGPNDSQCTVIRFRTLSGLTKAVLVHFTCHPTTTAANSLSAEFCGVAMTEIENELGDGSIAAFLQGCCGDVRPALSRDREFFRGDAGDVRRLGSELTSAVSALLSRPMEECGPALCAASVTHLPLVFDQAQPGSVPLEMTLFTLARDLGFLTFNAEMVVEYGLFVKQRSRGAILPLAYSNGMIGYVTTERQLAEGGYESREAFQYFNMPGPFAPSTEHRIRDAIDTLLTSVR
jgi:hypothetical protein